jgi:hypothetical protein
MASVTVVSRTMLVRVGIQGAAIGMAAGQAALLHSCGQRHGPPRFARSPRRHCKDARWPRGLHETRLPGRSGLRLLRRSAGGGLHAPRPLAHHQECRLQVAGPPRRRAPNECLHNRRRRRYRDNYTLGTEGSRRYRIHVYKSASRRAVYDASIREVTQLRRAAQEKAHLANGHHALHCRRGSCRRHR